MSLSNVEITEALLERDLRVYRNLSNLTDICVVIKDDDEHPEDMSRAIECAKIVKQVSSQESRTDIRFVDLYWKSLLLLAPYDFDSYLIYMERDRPAKNRFYLPRRTQFLKIGAVQLLQDLEDDKLDIAGLSVVPGAGKAQPLYSKVLTPTGFKQMGEISVGDEVISGNGNVSHAAGVYPQGKKSIYEVRLDGGYRYRCSDEHLVLVIDKGNWPIAVELKEIIENHDFRNLYSVRRESSCVSEHRINSIEYVGEEECQCIYIDDPCHLYITDNYIITHNTTLGEFYLPWIIGRHIDDYNIFASHSGGICRMFYDAVDALTSSPEYKYAEIFPEVKRYSTNAKEMQINFGKYKPFKSLSCVSVGQNLAGRVRANRLLYCDDLCSGIEEAVSKPRLDKLWQAYSVDLLQRRIDKCKELHVQTRWSVHDVVGRLKVKYSGNSRARFVAVPDIDPETGESNFNYKYGVGFSKEYFEDVANTMDDVSYRCLYKNEPIEREGLLYPEDSLRRYVALPEGEPDSITGICDTKNKGTDFLFLPCMKQYGNDYYMDDCICSDESDYEVQYQRIADIIVGNRMQMVDFESNNGGDRIGTEVERRLLGRQACGITMHYTTQNKETKIIVNAEWVKKHVLFKDKSLYAPKSDYGRAMSFLMTYTVAGKNDHDDVPDGMAQFASFVRNLVGSKTEIFESPF